MSNPRTDIDDLRLQGSPNLGRALRREAAESQPLPKETEDEIAALDELIAQAMKACRKGSTVGGRRNPAFANLQALVKTRDLLMKGKRPKKSSKSMLDEIDKLLATPVGN